MLCKQRIREKNVLICFHNGIEYPIIANSYPLLRQVISVLNSYTCNEYSVFALLRRRPHELYLEDTANVKFPTRVETKSV